MKAILTLAASAVIGFSSTAIAADFAPAVIYDTTGKFDKSFNEAVFRNGVERFMADTGVRVREFEPQNEEQREQGLRNLARRGQSPIITVGFNFATALSKVAPEFPDTQFVILDMVVDLPNVQSIVYREHEGSFLVGALAAMATESDKAGFVGGMDIPLIRKFGCGYEQGFKFVRENGEVFTNFAGSTGAAWNDPARGSELAKTQISQGAGVVFAAAGGTNLGVFQAAKDEGVYAIGVDSNQNYIQPGTILTSMLKKVGVASYQTWEAAQNGEWAPGITSLGLAEGGVDYSIDEFNESIVTPEMIAAVDDLKARIISGDIVVHDYMSDNSCTY